MIISTLLIAFLLSFSTYAKGSLAGDDFKNGSTFQVGLHEESYILPFYETDHQRARDARKRVEAKYQFSIKAGMQWLYQAMYFAYTQKSFWQVYDAKNSRPFRETNYNPELFVRFGATSVIWDVGIEHESNGQSDPESRSWDTLYTAFHFKTTHFKARFKFWHVYAEDRYGSAFSEKPNSMVDYYGHGDFTMAMRMGTTIFKFTGRLNTNTGRGHLDSKLLVRAGESVYYALTYTKGYGESLRDYNRSLESYGVGILINP